MMYDGVLDDEILNIVQRWEPLGLLKGLSIIEKTELAQIYDNATKLMLSETSIKNIPHNIFEIYEDVYLPVCRRLYKRVGPNFNLGSMMGELLEEVNKKGKSIVEVNPKEPSKNPIVSFCIDFSDRYEDEETNKNTLTKEEYSDKVGRILDTVKKILTNDKIVSYVNNVKGVYTINESKALKTTQQTRFWNQSVAKNLLTSALSNINKDNE